MNPEQPQNAAPVPQPTSAPVSPAPAATPTSGGGKKLSKGTIIGIIAAVIVLAAAIAYGVYAYVSNTPDNLLQSAIDNLKDKKSLAASYKIVNGTEQNGVTFSGDLAAMTDPSNSKNAEVIFGLGTGDKRVMLSGLAVGDTAYFKFTNAENLSTLMSSFGSDSVLASPDFASSLKNLDNQWFELQPSDVKSLAQSGGNDNVTGAVSPQDLQKVLDIYRQHPFIKVDKTFADQVVGGANSAHFSLKVDVNTEVAFLQAVKDANLSTIKVTDDDIAKAKTESATSADSVVEVWIARDSHQFKQVKMTNTKKGEESSITLTLMGSLPTFDKFQKPSGAKPISELLTTLLGTSVNPAELNAIEQSQSDSMLQ